MLGVVVDQKGHVFPARGHDYRCVCRRTCLIFCIIVAIVLRAGNDRAIAESIEVVDWCERTTPGQREELLTREIRGTVNVVRLSGSGCFGDGKLAQTTYKASDAFGASELTAAPTRAIADDLDQYMYLPLVTDQGPLAQGGSKIGLHTCFPGPAVGFVQAVHDAGAHVALVKATDDFGYLRRVKEISPETVTVARWSGLQGVDPTGDPAEKAAEVMAQHLPRWAYEKDVVDYWEVLNENDPPGIEGHIWLAQFYLAAMDIADANGYKLALFSYSVGVPQWHEWEAIVETGIFAQAKQRGHVLALHEYGWPTSDARWGESTEDLPPYEDRGVLTGRYRYLYRDFLIPRDEVIPLVITEAGFDPTIAHEGWDNWKPRYVDNMIWYDTKLREDDYVVGAALFTLGGSGAWVDWNYEELLWPGHPYGGQNFLDYIVSLKDE